MTDQRSERGRHRQAVSCHLATANRENRNGCYERDAVNVQYTNVQLITIEYVLVITHPGGIWLIYKHDPRGHKAPEGGVLINQPYPNCRSLLLIYCPLLGLALEGSAIASVSQLVRN